MRAQVPYSKYNRQVVATGSALENLASILILPLSGLEVWPSNAPRSGVRSKSSMKYSFMNDAFDI